MILCRNRNNKENSCIELFFNNGYSFLLDFYQSDSLKVAKAFQKVGYPNADIIQKGSASTLFSTLPLKNQWENGLLSNFAYLLLLNVFSGHSFHDPALEFLMPQLPIHNNTLGNVSNLSSSVTADYYITPSDERDYQFLYNLRTFLESDSVSKYLDNYIDNVFGYKMSLNNTPFSQLFKKKHSERHLYSPQSTNGIKISRAFSVKTKLLYANYSNHKDSSYLVASVTTTGLIKLIKIDTLPTLKTEIINTINSSGSFNTSNNNDIFACVSFSGYLKKLLIYNIKKCQMTIFAGDKNERVFFSSDTNIMACSDTGLIYCPNMCSIATYSFLTGRKKIIWNADSKITNLAVSPQFKMFAFSTIQNDLSVHSLNTGCEVNKIKLNSKIEHILITEQWGFILAFTRQNVYLFSVNGVQITSSPFNDTVVTAFTFSTISGFDYIVYQNSKKQIIIFEAFYPTMNLLTIDSTNTLKCAIFDIYTASIILIYSNGLVKLLPIETIISKK